MDDSEIHRTGDADSNGAITLRPRRHDDMDACVALLSAVHAADGYPLLWPADPATWLTPNHLLEAWVAEREHALVGHVALGTAVGDSAAPLWSAAAGRPPEKLAVVAKLFVSPRARGHGLGPALLREACAEACRRGLHPALEVLNHDRADRVVRARKMAPDSECPGAVGSCRWRRRRVVLLRCARLSGMILGCDWYAKHAA